MHAKIQILKFPEYVRVVVPSGNLTRYDWGETGVLENVSKSTLAWMRALQRIKDTTDTNVSSRWYS